MECEKCGKDVPKCPACGSTDIRKMSAADKVTTMLLSFSFNTLASTFKCKKCGHDW